MPTPTAASRPAARSRRITSRLGLLVAVGTMLLSACTPMAETEVIGWINESRTQANIAPVEGNLELWMKAGAWSIKMAGDGHLSHSNLAEGISYKWTALGENVGVGSDLRSIQNALMASSGHRANILNARFRYVGVGIKFDGTRYWMTQVFMAL